MAGNPTFSLTKTTTIVTGGVSHAGLYGTQAGVSGMHSTQIVQTTKVQAPEGCGYYHLKTPQGDDYIQCKPCTIL